MPMLRRLIQVLWLASPLMAAQLLQRLFHLIDNRFIGAMGPEALLVHNVQYTVFVIGQLIALAGTTSCLAFWPRKEFKERKRSLLTKHLLLSVVASAVIAVGLGVVGKSLIGHFGVDPAFVPLAEFYLVAGLLNMILAGIYGVIDGVFVASGRFRTSLLLAAILLAGNVVLDATGVYLLNPTLSQDATAVASSMRFIAVSTTLLLSSMIAIALWCLRLEVPKGRPVAVNEILGVWGPEFGTCLIRAVSPLVFAYQLGFVSASKGFLVTFNLALHLAYLCCLPLTAAVTIAVRRASKLASGATETADERGWVADLLLGGFLPTAALLVIGSLFGATILHWSFGYAVPVDHVSFVTFYFLAVIVGQLGNVFSVPLRAMKLSLIVTRNFLMSELLVQLSVCQVLIFLGCASPATLWLVTLAFTVSYTLLTLRSIWLRRGTVVPLLLPQGVI